MTTQLRKPIGILTVWLLMAFGCANNVLAVDACSALTGSLNIALAPGSDNHISIPFTRTPVYCGTVQSTAGNNSLTVQGAPGWSPTTQWATPNGLGFFPYYVQITSGAKEGASYMITNNSSDTLMVIYADYAYSGCEGDLTGISTGDQLAIIPFWTLGTAFPDGAGITPSINTAAAGRRTMLLFFHPIYGSSGAFDNQIFYFYNFWRRSLPTTPASTNFNDMVILPGQPFIARQPTNGLTNVTFAASGSVVQYTTRTCLAQPTLAPAFPWDNYVANYHSTTQTLNQSNLSSAFTASNPNANPPAINDLLFVYDNSTAVFNKTPAHIYFYDVDHWADLNNPPYSIDRGGDPVFVPGIGVTVRKKTNSVTSVWVNPP